MVSFLKVFLCTLLLAFSLNEGSAQSPSVARRWNDALLNAIRVDFARPTVHARNLFHTSLAMYDAWAVYDDTASTFFLNHSFRHYYAPFEGIKKPHDIKAAREETMSYAVYRLLMHRFRNSPGANQSTYHFTALFNSLGYDPSFTSTDYSTGSTAALGNYLAAQLIEFGFSDGANELGQYENVGYRPVNPPLNPFDFGNRNVVDPNRWQPLGLAVFIDQGGTPMDGAPPFLSAEWGKVVPFALKKEDLKTYLKEGVKYWVYHDPGPPPSLNGAGTGNKLGAYKWNFSMVSIFGSHLDPHDGVMVDISPASIGNLQKFPLTEEEMTAFYQGGEGIFSGSGYSLNPRTGEPYQSQIVPRGDYTRVLAEFWADGPNSETPPGHWFTILNYVNDHPLFEKRMEGRGVLVDELEWDVKSYFVLGGAVHDAAIAAWGIKGYYDYVRPISAIRFMAEKGQSSDPGLPAFHPDGIPLVEGYVELVKEGDSLAGSYGEHINKIKLYSWNGAERADFPERKTGVGWILAQNWWPYQRTDFVTPPFAGYVSGHSTFSRSAAEVLTLLTGDAFFPGGMSQFWIKKSEYLDFEHGPSVGLALQWATYRDAADQCSLSRIWGGIHPPADDIPGRVVGQKIGVEVFHYAKKYFDGLVAPEKDPERKVKLSVYPNPATAFGPLMIKVEPQLGEGTIRIVNISGQIVFETELANNVEEVLEFNLGPSPKGVYIAIVESDNRRYYQKFLVQ